MAATVRPSLRLERALLRDGARLVVGMDEVGRGALAGPVSVGALALDLDTRSGPPGVAAGGRARYSPDCSSTNTVLPRYSPRRSFMMTAW